MREKIHFLINNVSVKISYAQTSTNKKQDKV